MSVQLVIKSAAQSVEDFALDCELEWTITQVKDEITALYPTKPKREHQKLIYGGKLLADHLILKSVLNQVQDIHTLHLVCPFAPASNVEKSNTKKEQTTPPVCPPNSVPTNPTDVYQQLTEQGWTSGITSGIPGSMNGMVYNSVPGTPQQYLAMQQMYTQMMTHYLSQYNGSLPYMPVVANTSQVQSPSAPLPPPNVPVNNPPPRQNEEEERDYIDYLYVFSRVAMFLAILLYYSSMTRVITVLIMVLLITMFVKINKQHRQEEMQRRANERQTTESNAPVPPPAETPVPTTSDTPAPSPSDDTTAPPAEEVAETPSAPEPQTPREIPPASVPETSVAGFVTAFFSSLIPSDPLPVNVN